MVREEEFAKQLRLARCLAASSLPPARPLEPVLKGRAPKQERSVPKARSKSKTEPARQKAGEAELAKERRRVGRQKAPASSPHLSEKRDLGLIVDDQTEIPEPLTEFCQLGAKSTLLGVVNLEKSDYDQKVLSSNLGGRKSSPRGKRLAILTSKTDIDERSKVGEIQFGALKTDPDILSLAELGSLMTALGNYGLESERCANAGAHLASCIMLAATIEGQLVICVSSFPEEAERALKRLQESNQINRGLKLGSVLEWDLGQLLKVAIEAQWLPPKVKRVPFPVADTAEVLCADHIRELRNLVHPGRLVRERNGQTITKEELDLLHDACVAVSLHLAQKLSPQMFDPEMPSYRIEV